MGRYCALLFIPLLAVLAVPLYIIFLKPAPPLPEMDLNAWWGPTTQKQDTTIRPFQIKFDATMIQDLKQRLKTHRKWTAPLEGVSFQYGFNSDHLDNWLNYWAEQYDFQAREKFLNQFPQFKTNIQGLDIHFIRVVPKAPAGKEVVPLLLLHGWPGSVREFYEAIPLLTSESKDRDFVFEVIVPSLPGYGFSDPAVKPGLGAAEMAVVFKNLMHRLGHKQFYLQGGDWGSVVGSSMITLFPNIVLGYHTNFPAVLTLPATLVGVIGSIYPPLLVEKDLEDRMYPLSRHWSYTIEESGYSHIQASKPDTVGTGLNDSPAGLLAYILEKFSTWTRPDHSKQPEGLSRFTKDKLIDNLMMYWVSGSITTSFRMYAESANKRQFGLQLDLIPTPVPTWGLQAKYELLYQPPSILRMKFTNLIGTTVIQDGGHFFAFELPKEFSEDVLKAVKEFRKLKKSKTEL